MGRNQSDEETVPYGKEPPQMPPDLLQWAILGPQENLEAG
jgi:hypothetical protein